MNELKSPIEALNSHIQPSAIKNKKLAMVVSLFNNHLTQKLYLGAQKAFQLYSIEPSVYWVPGAYELPFFSSKISKDYDAIVCLGILIKGETAHFDYISQYVTHSIGKVSIKKNKPILFGVLTVFDNEQAIHRSTLSKIEQNKGYEVALSALMLLSSLQKIQGKNNV